MTTIKTPLPEKKFDIIEHPQYAGESITSLNIEATLESIIDYLAELTEVVDGKQNALTIESTHAIHRGTTTVTPTLKVTLLNALSQLPRYHTVTTKVTDDTILKSYTIAFSDVEAIINRLVP